MTYLSEQKYKKRQSKTNLAFCYTISTSSAKTKTSFNGKMAPDTEPAISTTNLQRATDHFFQKK